MKTEPQIGNPGWGHLPMPFSIFSRAAHMFSAASEHRFRRVVVRNALRLAGLAVLAVLLLAGMPLAAQTVQFTGALTIVGSGFYLPDGVAVDASGNVYVADEGNGAVKEILAASGYTTVNTLASGLVGLQGVAVDGSGNVYFSASGPAVVMEILAVNGSIPASPTMVSLASGFTFCNPLELAVDGSGNVYVADECNDAVEEILAAGGYAMVNTLGSGFNRPFGVAVDQHGNVFVADTDNSEVKEMLAVSGSIPASPTINTLGSGFRLPTGVAVDGNGNVYVADQGLNGVEEILAVNGSIPATPTINALGSGFNLPSDVAVDESGKVFVADTHNNEVKEILVGGNFGFVNVGSSARNPVTFNFTFGASVTLGPTAVLTQGAAHLDFTDAGGSTCTANTATPPARPAA